MKRVWAVLALVAGLLSAPHAVLAQSPNIVISQVYGGAGCGTAGCSTYKNDYIELFNRGSLDVNVNGWSVQYSAATGTSWQVTALPNVTIPAGGYLLVAQGAGANGVNTLPTPDVTGSIAMSATAGKVAVVPSTTALSGACPLTGYRDLVGYGSTASCFEGSQGAPAPSTTNAATRLSAGCTDSDFNPFDFVAAAPAPRNSATAANVCVSSGVSLSVNNVSQVEGDSGSTAFVFTVSLSNPAEAGGVTFDIATADGTANDGDPVGEDVDYVAKSLTGQTIPAGESTYAFTVTVNGDTVVESNEGFLVDVTNVTGATVNDGQGAGTITNDDVNLIGIHDIQGSGAASPLAGATVSTRGIVTGRKSNGFFLQTPDADADADPATSEGVYVFTSSAPPAAAAVGAFVQVTGVVTEYAPSADAAQPPLTELTSPAVTLVTASVSLPEPIVLDAGVLDPAGPHDQLERLESMRVSLASGTVVAPTGGSVSEANATATTNGDFFVVATGVARPFREPGIEAPDTVPAGSSIPPVPRFDGNPEKLRVDSNVLGATALEVSTGTVVTGLVGPLDYLSRAYTLSLEPTATVTVAGGSVPTNVSAAAANEFTIASYNMQRFFDTTNDPGTSDVVLTSTAFENRLNKASLSIRNSLRLPDIIGVVEMENLATLQALAARVSADALAASQPDPLYQAYLVEGNDVGGIDVGFLVKTAAVGAGSTPRVEVVEVVQESATTLITNPDSSTAILNDRPPLRLNAIVHNANGGSEAVTVIANHLRSLTDVGSTDPGSSGWATTGARIRAKRQKQAEDLAAIVQARQAADPNERIVLLGDFNAFEFNDGFGDSMGVIAGVPAADNETVVPGDGVDLVSPDLINPMYALPALERYSYTFGGNAQNLDHLLVNQALSTTATAYRVEHARLNADFAETERSNPNTPTRLSDHDPLVAYFAFASFSTSDPSVSMTAPAGPIPAGGTVTYTITVSNTGPDADSVTLTDTLPMDTTFVSLTSPSGWSCTTPSVGSAGTVTCANPAFGVTDAVFDLVVSLSPSIASGAVVTNVATVLAPSDADDDNNSASTARTVTGSGGGAASADLSVSVTDSTDPVAAGATLTYTVSVFNDGPDAADSTSLTGALPSGVTFLSLSAPGGWSCSTPAVGSGGAWSCTHPSLANLAGGLFTLTVQVGASTPNATMLGHTVSVSSATTDPNNNNSGTATTLVTNAGPGTPVIPTLTEWAMILLGLLLAAGAVANLHRRRVQ